MGLGEHIIKPFIYYAMEVFEYHNNILGIQARYLFSGANEAPESLGLISYRGLADRVANGSIKKIRNNAPGVHTLLEFSTLSPGWRRLAIERFGTPPEKVNKLFFEKYYERDVDAVVFFTKYMLKDGKFLPDATIEEYVVNASVINTCFKVYELRSNIRKQMTGGILDIWETIAKESQLFKAIQSHTLPDHFRRLREKCMEYKKGGYDVLIHKNFANRNALKVDNSTISLLNNMFATQKHKPTATEVARQYKAFLSGYIEIYNNEFGEKYEPSNFKELSVGTITAWLGKWSNRVVTHAKRSGNNQIYKGKNIAYHSMEKPKYSNSIISIDDRQPPFAYAPQKRLWLYNAVDVSTMVITCSVHGRTKEGLIIEFYRQLVRNYTHWGLNMPAELEAESSLNSSFKDSFLRDGGMFQYVRIEANSARSKFIESVNGIFRYQYDKLRAGFKSRPKAIKEAYQAGPEKEVLIPYEDIVAGCFRDIEDNNNMPDPNYPDKTRWEVFLENQNPNVMPTNWHAILKSPVGYCTHTSCRTGIVKLNRKEFLLGFDGEIAYSEKLIGLLDQLEGKEFDVYWLDSHNGDVLKAHVYLGDTFICELIPKPISHRARIEGTPETMAARVEMSKYVASVQGYVNSQGKALKGVTIIGQERKTLNNKFSVSDMMGFTSQPKRFGAEEKPADDEPINLLHYPEYNEEEETEKVMNKNWNQDLKDRF